jgi:hypothetical protein
VVDLDSEPERITALEEGVRTLAQSGSVPGCLRGALDGMSRSVSYRDENPGDSTVG